MKEAFDRYTNSLSAPLETYREQIGEFAHWCWGVKG